MFAYVSGHSALYRIFIDSWVKRFSYAFDAFSRASQAEDPLLFIFAFASLVLGLVTFVIVIVLPLVGINEIIGFVRIKRNRKEKSENEKKDAENMKADTAEKKEITVSDVADSEDEIKAYNLIKTIDIYFYECQTSPENKDKSDPYNKGPYDHWDNISKNEKKNELKKLSDKLALEYGISYTLPELEKILIVFFVLAVSYNKFKINRLDFDEPRYKVDFFELADRETVDRWTQEYYALKKKNYDMFIANGYSHLIEWQYFCTDELKNALIEYFAKRMGDKGLDDKKYINPSYIREQYEFYLKKLDFDEKILKLRFASKKEIK